MADIFAAIFLLLGLFFFGSGVVGVIRLPDAYSRLHASGKVSVLGLMSILVGAGFLVPSAIPKLIALGLFVVLSGPVASHAIALSRFPEDRSVVKKS